MKNSNKLSVLVFLGLFLIASPVFGAITIGTSGHNGTQGTNTFTATGSGDLLYVGIQGTTAVTAVTCGGVAMTQKGTNAVHTQWGRTLNQWILVSPATDCSVVMSGGANVSAGYQYFTGVDTSAPTTDPDNVVVTSSAPSLTLTSTVDNAYIMGNALINAYTSVGTDTTSIVSINGDANNKLIRSTNALATAGNGTLNLNTTGGMTAINAVFINPLVEEEEIIIPAGEQVIQVETYATILFVTSISLFMYILIFSWKRLRSTRGRV